MKYVRTFILQSAHLNSAKSYEIVWDAVHGSLVASKDLLYAMKDCHGHNFKIEIVLEGDLAMQPWLVDDIALTKLVMEWDNTNLSVHPDFLDTKTRATTENMAMVLLDKLRDAFSYVSVKRVTVYETEHIHAVAE